jgi:hypothetical protein
MTEVARRYLMFCELLGGTTIHEGVDRLNAIYNDSPIPTTPNPIPEWDSCTRTLRFRGRVVKEYRRARAENQMAVLNGFEELRWPSATDADVPKEKIGETVRSLNNSIGPDAPIRFFRDGTGKRIAWEEK